MFQVLLEPGAKVMLGVREEWQIYIEPLQGATPVIFYCSLSSSHRLMMSKPLEGWTPLGGVSTCG